MFRNLLLTVVFIVIALPVIGYVLAWNDEMRDGRTPAVAAASPAECASVAHAGLPSDEIKLQLEALHCP